MAHLVELNINFKDACKRIWKILANEVSEINILLMSRDIFYIINLLLMLGNTYSHVLFQGYEGLQLNPTKCIHCQEYTCIDQCIIDRQTSTNKVALDIGGKVNSNIK